jgi:hypothetical protein
VSSQATTHKPTSRQLSYLRVLAEQTGTSFTSPASTSQASREIKRLTQLKATRGRHIETPDGGQPTGYGTAPQAHEVAGWGSQARWNNTTPPRRVPASRPSVGERTELARYTAKGQERVMYGQRINGSVRVTDRPATGPGRSFLIDSRLEQDGYAALQALIADYLAQVERHDQIPMVRRRRNS